MKKTAVSNQRQVRKPVIILPTYNESGTITAILNAVIDLSLPLTILVVDDASPDGTQTLVEKHPAFHQRLFLIKRPEKMGLASAYKHGFQWALDRGYDLCLEMDSDLSHNPEDIPRFITAIQQGADVVVGSRYLEGINVVNWPLYRLLLSRGAGVYTRMLTGLPLTDPTSGFKAIHRDVITRLDWGRLKAEGYGFQIELNYFAYLAGFYLKEIPIVFTERQRGSSKRTLSIALEAVLRVPQLALIKRF
jgi:dolichol-phosphate mannosyltransferase